jgi:hypothetical protein
MSRIGLTIGDTGVTISGTITQRALGSLSNLSGCSVTFSLYPRSGAPAIIDARPATLGAFTPSRNQVAVSYRLQSSEVAAPFDDASVEWVLTLADGSKITAPGPGKEQTYLYVAARTGR